MSRHPSIQSTLVRCLSLLGALSLSLSVTACVADVESGEDDQEEEQTAEAQEGLASTAINCHFTVQGCGGTWTGNPGGVDDTNP